MFYILLGSFIGFSSFDSHASIKYIKMEEEKILTWVDEAEAVINDIKKHVKLIEVSKNIPSTNQQIYLNLTTLEGFEYCIEMSGCGFTIVGKKFDSTAINNDEYFETPYSLLNSVSEAYKKSFGNELVQKLDQLRDRT